MRKLALLVLLLAVAACRRDLDRAPVVVGSKSAPEAVRLSEHVARRLEEGGCRAERRFQLGGTAELDRLIAAGTIDVYVESHRDAVRDVLKLEPGEAPDNEAKVRAAHIRRDLLWAPGLGVADYGAVFRKDVDRKCRAASRILMATAYSTK